MSSRNGYSSEHVKPPRKQGFRLSRGGFGAILCVLFPPLCLSASTAHEALKATTLTENAIDVFLETNKPRYVFRFKLLEWFGW